MKQLDRPLPNGRGRYDEIRFRDSLQALGLVPPVDLEDVHRAYKTRARRIHPDRFGSPEEREQATRKIQEINAARDYVLRHFRGFDLMQTARYRANGRPRGADPAAGRWTEWALLPITAPYALATLGVAAPLVALKAVLGAGRCRSWRARLGIPGQIAWRVWVGLAPHLAVAAAAVAPLPVAVRVWAGVAALVMASADLATLVTGDANELRRHRPVQRARSLAEQVATPA